MGRNWIYWFGGWFFDFTKIVTFILFALLLVHFFVSTLIVVRGASMEPNYTTGDLVLIEKVSYLWNNPEVGDIVGIFFPTIEQRRIIKRVIAVPGETVEIASGRILINDVVLDEPYLPADTNSLPNMTYTLKQDEYFVLGDNRENSSDSRIFGPLPKSAIIGKELLYMLNFNNIWPFGSN